MIWPTVTDVFGPTFMQRALLAGLLVSLVCTLLGVFTVLRGLALISDGLAHFSFSGIALGVVVGADPLGYGLAAGVLGAVGIFLVRATGWVKSDVAIGLFFTAGLAVGGAIVTRRGSINVARYLFGSVLTVTDRDIALTIGLSIVLLASIALFYKELVYLTFDEQAARVSGLPVGGMNFGVSVVTGAAVVLASQFVGVLLVTALVVVPAAAALQVARSFRNALLVAVLVGFVSVALGLYASFAFDVAAGPAIAGVDLLAFAAASVVRGVASRGA